jgi:glycosyltransferase involved in cell wall biosynthesis
MTAVGCHRPLISVIMPVYNGASYLPAAIESILGQSYSHLEFIIVDDGSTDGSAEIVSAYARDDGRIRNVCMDHGGVARALNTGTDLARGEWIARMDSDDIALPDRLAAQLDWAERNGVDICGGQVETFGAEQRIFWFPQSHDAICAELIFRPALLHPTLLLRSHILKANPYDPESTFEDYEMYTRLGARYRLGNVPRVLLKYRRHAHQTQILNEREIRRDLGRYRFRYVYSLFPDTPLPDYLALARVADRRPMTSVSELRRAGEWLIHLAALPDRTLRQRMAFRWRRTWERSAALGPECDRIFFDFQKQFESESIPDRIAGPDSSSMQRRLP